MTFNFKRNEVYTYFSPIAIYLGEINFHRRCWTAMPTCVKPNYANSHIYFTGNTLGIPLKTRVRHGHTALRNCGIGS